MQREQLIAVIVAVALFMEQVDATIIATALPAIAADLGTTPLKLNVAVTAYLLALAIFIPVSGWFADRFGARNVFRGAIVVFMVGSVLCALSTSLPAFVAPRILQGMGGAMMTPVARLIIVRTVDKQQLLKAMAFMSIPGLAGPLFGPPLGGLIVTIATWHWIFIVNIPIGIIALFSFNDPKGKFNYSWQGFTLKNWADPFKYPALTDPLKLSLNVAAVSTAIGRGLKPYATTSTVSTRTRMIPAHRFQPKYHSFV